MARILIIAYTTYAFDGRVRYHAEALAERGDKVDVICLDGPALADTKGVRVNGLKIRRYRGQSRHQYVRSYLRFFWGAAARAVKLSMSGRFDIVIVCTMPDAMILSALPTRFFGSRIVLDVHDTMPELYRDKFGGRRGAIGARLLMAEERASAWLADRVIAVHEPHRRRLSAAGIPERKISVVANAPDPRLFNLVHNGNGHRPDSDFTIACHGTITHRIGIDILLDAMNLLRSSIPGLKLLVIGRGDYLEQAKKHAADVGVADITEFAAAVPLEMLPNLLTRASVGVVPNRATSATQLMLPVKLLEYISLGIPVVAARLGAIQHYFSEDSIGFFEPGNTEDLARALEEMYREPIFRAERAARARKSMESALNWSSERKCYCSVIDSLLGAAPGRDNGRANQDYLHAGGK
ncbi:MAG: glycosyltransferase family 4 protein [Candidatus Binataceae bacterium]